MELFKLFGTIAIDASEANNEIDNTADKASNLGTSMQNIGSKITKTGVKITAATTAAVTATGAAVMGFANNTAATADNIDKMSQKIGISREAYQELDFICSQSGTSVDQLQTGMKTLTDKMQAASDGTESAMSMFQKLGVSVTDSKGKMRSQEDVMFDTIAALQGMENQAEKAALASDLFGRMGTELMPLLNGQAGSMEEMKQQAHDLGLIMSDEAVNAGVEYTDTMDQLKRSFSAAAASAGAELLPHITTLAQWLIEKGVPAFENIIEKVTGVVEWFMNLDSKTQRIIEIIGIALVAIGPILSVVGTLITIGGTLATVIGAISAPVLIVIGVITALIAIGVALYKNWDTIKAKCAQFVSAVKEKFTAMKTSISTIFTSIKTTIKNVWDGIWTCIKGVINKILGGVESMVNGVIKGINKILGGVEAIANSVGSLLGLDPISLTLSEVKLPRLAKGGVLEKGQIGFLEGDGAEAVVPLEKNREWIARVSDEMQHQGIGGDKATLNVLNEILAAMNDLKDSNEDLPERLKDAIANLKFSINNREFARLVKAV